MKLVPGMWGGDDSRCRDESAQRRLWDGHGISEREHLPGCARPKRFRFYPWARNEASKDGMIYLSLFFLSDSRLDDLA